MSVDYININSNYKSLIIRRRSFCFVSDLELFGTPANRFYDNMNEIHCPGLDVLFNKSNNINGYKPPLLLQTYVSPRGLFTPAAAIFPLKVRVNRSRSLTLILQRVWTDCGHHLIQWFRRILERAANMHLNNCDSGTSPISQHKDHTLIALPHLCRHCKKDFTQKYIHLNKPISRALCASLIGIIIVRGTSGRSHFPWNY